MTTTQEFILIAVMEKGNPGSEMLVSTGIRTATDLKRAIDERLASSTKYITLIAMDKLGRTVRTNGNVDSLPPRLRGITDHPGDRATFQDWYRLDPPRV
jgi:hypothetical protein